MAKKTKLLKIREAAEMLGVNPETLRRWDRDGTFKAIRVGKQGHRLYDEDKIAKLINAQKMICLINKVGTKRGVADRRYWTHSACRLMI